MRTPFVTAVVAVVAVVLGTSALAGPLDPPVGPIAGTHKPLGEIEPRTAINATNTPGDADSTFVISQPGSYYLTGNVIGEPGKHGIKLTSGGVTLDLGGFGVFGVPTSGTGIVVQSAFENIEIRSGMVANWGQSGIDLSPTKTCRVYDIRATRNIGGGGIRVGSATVVTHCAASGNNFGFSTEPGCVVSDCTAFQNQTGFILGSGATLTDSVASFNTTQGVNAVMGASIVKVSAFNNSGDGILASTGCVVTDCTARFNGLAGLRVTNNNIVTNNTCSENGQAINNGAGILVVSNDNRIEGNNCTNQDRGIRVDTLGNFIARNICSGNTINWEVSTGNICLVLQATASPPITGNAGGVSAGSNDPNANYTY